MVSLLSLRHDCSGYFSRLLYWFVRMDVFLFSPNMHWIITQFHHTYVLNITILPLQKIYFPLCLVSLYFYKIFECILRTFFLIYITLCINFYLVRLDNFGPVNLNTFIIVMPETHSKLFAFIVTFSNTVFRSQLKPWQYITIYIWYVFVTFSRFVCYFELILDPWEFHEHTCICRNIFSTRLFWYMEEENLYICLFRCFYVFLNQF
jgi:hypothetical protein